MDPTAMIGEEEDDPLLQPPDVVFVPRKRSRYALGLCILGVVIFLWVASGVAIQQIFQELDFDKPFFLTYFSTSLFNIYGLLFLARRYVRRYRPPAGPGDALEAEGPMQTASPKMVRLALLVSPIWIGMNYLYNLSLDLTSVASSTILTSMSGPLVLMLGVPLLRQKVSLFHVVGVAMTIGGVVAISLSDTSDSDKKSNPILGDVLALGSALLYAIYTIILRWRVPDDSSFDITLLFGLIGLINFLFGMPLLAILHFSSAETFEFPEGWALGALLLNGVFGTVISGMLWAKSVLLTSPLVATTALSLTMPLAMVADAVVKGSSFRGAYFAGSALVFAGFLLVNWASQRGEKAAPPPVELGESGSSSAGLFPSSPTVSRSDEESRVQGLVQAY